MDIIAALRQEEAKFEKEVSAAQQQLDTVRAAMKLLGSMKVTAFCGDLLARRLYHRPIFPARQAHRCEDRLRLRLFHQISRSCRTKMIMRIMRMMSAVSIGAASLPCHLLCSFSKFRRALLCPRFLKLNNKRLTRAA